MVFINLVSPFDFFQQLFLNHGLVGRTEEIASQPNVEAAMPGATLKVAPITFKPIQYHYSLHNIFIMVLDYFSGS